MTVKLSTWRKNDLVRVYVSGLSGQGYADKVWFERQAPDTFGCNWTVKARVAALTSANRDLADRASDLIGQSMADCAAVSFDHICAKGE